MADGSRRSASRSPRPSVSVVVALAAPGDPALRGCLASLVDQTLHGDRFEVVVACGAADSVTAETVEDVRSERADLSLRLLLARKDSLAAHRNHGLAAARGDIVVMLGVQDRIGPRFLQVMLDHAAPDVVVVPPEIHGVAIRGARQSLDVVTHERVDLLHGVAGRALPVALARAACFDPRLGENEVVAYWLAVSGRQPFSWRLAGDEATMLVLGDNEETSAGGDGRDDGYAASVTRPLATARTLSSVECRSPDSIVLRDVLLREQASAINAHLRGRPQDHDRVVAEARELGMTDLPWSVINEGLARDLAICYCFPPSLDTSGVVAAKRLRERGLVTDVISHDMSSARVIDPQSVQVAGEFLGRTHVVPGKVSFAGWGHISAFAAEAWETAQAWEREQGSYRSLYSRAMAPASHFAAALVKARRPDLRWVAEFSDPLQINTTGEERVGEVVAGWLSDELQAATRSAGYEPGDEGRLFRWGERLVYALADEIVFTNVHQRDMMLGYCEDAALVERARSIGRVQHHPVLPPSYYQRGSVPLDCSREAVHVAYFGVFYGTRDLSDVVTGLLRLRQDERERLCLHVFTPRPDKLTLEMTRLGLAGTVHAAPYVPVLEFLHLTTKFDVLLVTDAVTAEHHALNPYLPSKVADYRGSGTPIWSISETNSTMSSMQFEYSSTLGDVDQTLAVLRRIGKSRRSAPSAPAPDVAVDLSGQRISVRAQ